MREPATDTFAFIYGTCKLPPGDEARCGPPVQVFVSPPCRATDLPGSLVRDRFAIRGQEVIATDEGSLRIDAPDFTLVVYVLTDNTASTRQGAIEAVQTLRGANPLAAALTPDSPLGVRLQRGQVCP